MPDFTPADELVIDNLDTLKVLADPLRLRIIEYLQSPGTVREVADRIHRPPTKLYYHINLLEKHKLIHMVETRIVSGIVEKHYQVAAYRYRLAWGLLSPQDQEFEERVDVTLSGLLGSTRADIYDSLKAGIVDDSEGAPEHRQLMLRRMRSMMTPERADEFYAKLHALVVEYGFTDKAIDRDDPERQLYKLFLALHPSSQQKSGD